jgi:hypothetical protein
VLSRTVDLAHDALPDLGIVAVEPRTTFVLESEQPGVTDSTAALIAAISRSRTRWILPSTITTLVPVRAATTGDSPSSWATNVGIGGAGFGERARAQRIVHQRRAHRPSRRRRHRHRPGDYMPGRRRSEVLAPPVTVNELYGVLV